MMNVIDFANQAFFALIGGGTGLVSTLVYNVFATLISYLPDGGNLPQGVHTAAIYFGNALSKVSFIVPTDTLMTCLIIILTLKVSLWAFHVFRMFINWVRGIPTGRYDGYMLPDEGPPPMTVSQRTAWFHNG